MTTTTKTKHLEQTSLIHPLSWVEVDLKALVYNWEQLKKLASAHMAHSAGIMPVIKADAYGHGMIPVAKALSDAGCKLFSVSNAQEGVALREAGFTQKILLFESTLPGDAAAIVSNSLTPTVC